MIPVRNVKIRITICWVSREANHDGAVLALGIKDIVLKFSFIYMTTKQSTILDEDNIRVDHEVIDWVIVILIFISSNIHRWCMDTEDNTTNSFILAWSTTKSAEAIL